MIIPYLLSASIPYGKSYVDDLTALPDLNDVSSLAPLSSISLPHAIRPRSSFVPIVSIPTRYLLANIVRRNIVFNIMQFCVCDWGYGIQGPYPSSLLPVLQLNNLQYSYNVPGMMLSRKHPKNPPTKMVVPNKTDSVPSNSLIPVFIAPGCFSIHWHKTNGKNIDRPMMYRFRDERKSTYCSADKPSFLIRLELVGFVFGPRRFQWHYRKL